MAIATTFPFSLAGTKLGLSAEDLAKRYGLTEDQAEGIYTEFGQYNIPKMTETTYKGRGARTLGYQVGGLPTRTETIFENFAPDIEPPKEELADRFLSSFIGEKGTPGILGAEALGAAKEYGFTTEDILSKAKEEGLKFGEQAARSLDLPYVSDLAGARTAQADPNFPRALGLTAVKKLEDEGYSKPAIKGLASQQGIKFGEAASSYLGGAPLVSRPEPKTATNLSSFIDYGAGGTSGFLGRSAVQRAKATGLSESDIKNLAAKQGLQFGAKAFT